MTAEEQARDRDLGFGSTVSRESQQWLLNRDGSFNVVRSGLGLLESLAPYHQLLTISWAGFLGLVTLIYLGCNLVFAVAYVACGFDALMGPGAEMLGGRFGRAFFFSIQMFATIGYGQIGPNGFAANLIVTVEALVGLMYQALATGLLFARFARPTASILFSRSTVVGPYNGGRGLMFHIVNRRRNEIIQLDGAQRPRRHRAAVRAAPARAEPGHVLPAGLDDRAPDRRGQSAGEQDTRGTGAGSG